MGNIIIGIVGRDEDVNGTKIQAIVKNNLKYLHNRCSYIGIVVFDNNDSVDYDVLNLCDAIIIQGGSDIYPYHFQIVEYAINNNIPLLGICMGHQIIGLYNQKLEESDLVKIDNHYSKDELHLVNLTPGTYLEKILGKSIYVNSRHLYKLDSVSEPLIVSAKSTDDVIEAIEWIDDDHLIIGVQWHPEDMNNMDDLYNFFISETLKRRLMKK